MITPTVGRKVWYRPSEADKHVMAYSDNEPLDATVVAVWNNRCVNLAIFDTDAKMHARHSVPLIQEGDAPPYGNYAEWMPYQTAQAKKHEEAQ